ncbi:hypothetical protein [Mucilaginibacter pedocola]|uniref:Uncharacterized protein n=1 Tax=Mucilaginibacter pedocola TaxID=1792845 RepID=A0A1S9PC40_9SPHI|nr:hypothetical protein [Mucilaginibacter pedocola]OOQ58556.1 hypothetical protein BC343_07770 [Mucilaginibacter pedocola]
MKVDNPNAFRFLLQDDIYLLAGDKALSPAPFAEPTPEPQVQAPQPVQQTAQAPIAEPVKAPVTVAIPTIPQPIKTAEPAFNYLGGNNKQFAILVNYATEEHIPAAHLAAMENILKRKELALADVAIFNMHKHQPLAIAKVAEILKPAKMVIMGKDAMPQGIGNLPFNSPVQGKKTTVLYSFSFDDMMSSNDNKKAFWDQMKTL